MLDGPAPVLEVADLRTVFATRDGEVHAVNGVSFFTATTGGHYIQAADTLADGNVLTIDVVNGTASNGPAGTATLGGAIVNWLFTAGQANLSVWQSAPVATPVAGTPMTYTIVVANGGPASATAVTLTSTIPSGLSHASLINSHRSASEYVAGLPERSPS